MNLQVDKKPSFKIAGREIGYNFAPLVISEIGINHEGSLETAFELVDAAISAGAEVIKHQTHVVEDEMTEEAKKIIPQHTKQNIFDIIKNFSLNEKDEFSLMNYTKKKRYDFY